MDAINTVLLALAAISLLSIAIDISFIKKVLRDMAEVMRAEATDPDSIIDCPLCSTDHSFWEIEWKEDEPDVGVCPNCCTVWQNLNTRSEPRLKEVRSL
jgi:hypothetical protein